MVSEQWYFSFLSLRIFYPLIYAYKQIIASPQIFNVFIYFKSSNRSILVDWRFVIFTIEIIHREFASIFSINSIKAITQSIVHNGNPRTFCVLWKSSCLEGYANFKLLSLQMARALNRAFPRFIVFFFFFYLLLRGILPSWREESRFTIHVNGTITLHALKTIIFPRYIFHVHPHVVHHFLEIRYLFFALSKNQEGNLFAQLFLSIIGIVPSSRTANFQPVTTDLLFRSRLDISTSFYTFEARSS